jgi:hypothetical protein
MVKHDAHVAHHAKGRLRVRVPSAKGNPAALEKIKKSMEALDGVREIHVNAITGSITIHYDPKKHAEFHKHLSGKGEHKKHMEMPPPPALTEIDEMAEQLEKEAEYLSKHSHTAKALFDLIRQFDHQLKKATGNQVDLKVITPLGLAVYAFLELGFEAATPVWLTLTVFSFNHFVELHTHHEHASGQKAFPTRPKF